MPDDRRQHRAGRLLFSRVTKQTYLDRHTLEPTSQGAMVHLYGGDQATLHGRKGARKHDTYGKITYGRGEFIGADTEGSDREQRDAARSAYEATIRADQAQSTFPGRDVRKTWDDIRFRWGGGLSPQDIGGGLTETSRARARALLLLAQRVAHTRAWNEPICERL